MAIVLGVFFGAGAALFRVVQQAPGGGASGLDTLLYGKTALLRAADVWAFAGLGATACGYKGLPPWVRGLTRVTRFVELKIVAYHCQLALAAG